MTLSAPLTCSFCAQNSTVAVAAGLAVVDLADDPDHEQREVAAARQLERQLELARGQVELLPRRRYGNEPARVDHLLRVVVVQEELVLLDGRIGGDRQEDRVRTMAAGANYHHAGNQSRP